MVVSLYSSSWVGEVGVHMFEANLDYIVKLSLKGQGWAGSGKMAQ